MRKKKGGALVNKEQTDQQVKHAYGPKTRGVRSEMSKLNDQPNPNPGFFQQHDIKINK